MREDFIRKLKGKTSAGQVGVLTVELYGNLCIDRFEPVLPDGR